MTMPKTAEVIIGFDGIEPRQFSTEQLRQAIDALRIDLPGAVELVELAATCAQETDEFTVFKRTPAETGSTEEWTKLVGYLSRMFASPFGAIAQEWTRREFSAAVSFVNCCIILSEPKKDEVDPSKAWAVQVSQQITPDC